MGAPSFGDRSRLVIKNIPNSLDNKALDRLITKKCKELGVTKCDVRLLTKEKKVKGEAKRISRGICYVGFISEKDATKFMNHYNNSYFNSCKVAIEYSKSPGQAERAPQAPSVGGSVESVGGKLVVRKEVTPRKAGVASKQVHITFDSDAEEAESEEGGPEGDEFDARGTHPDRAANILSSTSDAGESQDAHATLDMNRVVIFNLPYSVTEEMIRNLVKPYGKVEQIHIPLNRHDYSDPASLGANATKGMCFVTFTFESDAHKFAEEKNKSIFAGRLVTVSLAQAQPQSGEEPGGPGRYHNKRRNEVSFSKFKKRKRAQESSNPDIWNALHIDIHAAVSSITAELGLESEQVLRAEEAGVNAALSESYVLGAIKKWMDQQGIEHERPEYGEDEVHEDVLLIKNLPHDADDAELARLLGTCGQILRFTTSPFKLLGLVQFSSKLECDRALRTLSYRMYRGLPLYLQKISRQMLPDSERIESNEALLNKGEPLDSGHADSKADGQKLEQSEDKDTREESDEESEQRVGHVSVYVSNIDPSVDEQELDKHFGQLPGFIISKIIRPAQKGDEGAEQRARYGFVEFDSLQSAREAIRSRCGTLVAGRALNLELSRNKQTISSFSKRRDDGPGAENDVIIVKNLPFQATKKELADLFKHYANVKTVRVPRSAGNKHRGFGFVEFLSKADARLAMEGLRNVHLYGRRLVLQYVENAK